MSSIIAITCYHSLKDPIIEGLLLRYLQKINESGEKYKFLLITFEQPQYSLSGTDKKLEMKRLESQGIMWRPLRYRSGGVLLVFKKLLNFLSVLWILLKSMGNYEIKAIMGFTSLSGAIAAVAGALFRKRVIIYCFEPHSKYQADFGIWSHSSLSYQILLMLEKFQVRKADHLIVPTRHGVELVRAWGTDADVEVMPVSVDENLFVIDQQIRKKLRTELRLEGKQVVFYLGKFGGIYYSVETVARFYTRLAELGGDYHFLIITTSPVNEVTDKLKDEGLDRGRFTVLPPVKYSEVNKYINASDLGILAVPSLPSQKYRTPIKTANYLLCGLPYLVNSGVAEDDLVALDDHVGVVANIDLDQIAKVHQDIQALLGDPSVRLRCREVGLKHRKLFNTTSILDKVFNEVMSK